MSQEGAICVIDTGLTVLRVKHSRLMRETSAWNDAAISNDAVSAVPSLAPHERSDIPRERSD